MDRDYEQNQAAFHRLKDQIAATYPTGRFVAICDEEIVADAASARELYNALVSLGKDPKRSMAVQAGVDYSEYVVILAKGKPT